MKLEMDLITLGYAATLAAGGVIGYVKAGSLPSLGMGLLFGGILTYGAAQLYQNPNNYALTLGASTVLLGLMGYRFYGSGKLFPAGVISVLSALMVARLGLRAIGMKTP